MGDCNTGLTIFLTILVMCLLLSSYALSTYFIKQYIDKRNDTMSNLLGYSLDDEAMIEGYTANSNLSTARKGSSSKTDAIRRCSGTNNVALSNGLYVCRYPDEFCAQRYLIRVPGAAGYDDMCTYINAVN